MKYILNIKSDQDTVDETYVVDKLEDVGLALKEYSEEYCECYSHCSRFDVEIIPANEIKKGK